MKGIVFTEFLEMVESQYGLEILDMVITDSNTKSNGVYTSVGNYDYKELLSLVDELSKVTKTAQDVLVERFGEYMFETFTKKSGSLFHGITNPMDFLSKVDGYIHVEVAKLYPGAELPKFEVLDKSKRSIEMIYSSNRRLSDFAVGLIKGCGKYFNIPLNIKKEDLSNGNGSRVKFCVTID